MHLDTIPKVSIIIPCYNSAWSIPNLVRYLTPFVLDNTEIVFVDDGSTDNSFDLFQSMVPTATCLRQENQGVGASRNRAANIASGEFLQLLDADDTIEPGKLEAQCAFARAHALDVVYSDWRMVIVDGRDERPGPFSHAKAPAEMVEALLGGWWYPPNAALIRRDAYLSIGGCDPTLGNTCEDFDLMVRLAIAGYNYGYLPGGFASYYRYLERKSLSRRNTQEFFMGEEQIILRALRLLEERNDLTLARRRASAKRLHAVARNVYSIDKAWFNRLLDQVYGLDPTFQPSGSPLYRTTVRLMGLERAENLASLKRTWRFHS